MIKKLRVKFISAAMLSLALVLLVILGGVNLISYQKVVSDADGILTVLSANQGAFPKPGLPSEHGQPGGRPGQQVLSPETPYESRFFSALVSLDGQVIHTDTGQIAAVDDTAASSAALEVWNSGRSAGFWENYRYIRCDEAAGTRIIFLDCGRSLSSFRTLLFASTGVSLIGCAVVLVLLLFFSKRIIRPVAESYEKQKRFITDAGHELKTPLTIISADTDLVRLEFGDSEWLTDISRQVQRLTGLTQDLTALARMDEEQPQLHLIEFPISDLVEETAQPFQAPAQRQGKRLDIRVQPLLSYTGDEKALRQLISILLDNALKYSPSGGLLSVTLEKQGRNLVLSISNTTSAPVEKAELGKLFDRFYRADPARQGPGGYGLGLSIAQGIVQNHKGKIRAESPEEHTLSFVVNLPL